MKKKTIWETVANLVNSKKIGQDISRREIIKEVHSVFEAQGERYSTVTIDCIRNMSSGLGYLIQTDTAGHYTVMKHYQKGYSHSQLRRDYDLKIQKHRDDYNKHRADKQLGV